jgi:hypothetical protein
MQSYTAQLLAIEQPFTATPAICPTTANSRCARLTKPSAIYTRSLKIWVLRGATRPGANSRLTLPAGADGNSRCVRVNRVRRVVAGEVTRPTRLRAHRRRTPLPFILSATVLLVGALCLMLFPNIQGHDGSAVGAELAETAQVVDGDTISLAGARIRLWGIDAPERAQTCKGGAETPTNVIATRPRCLAS